MMKHLIKEAPKWCPGCTNFMILASVKKVFANMKPEETVIVTGIGCHAKINDQLNVNGIYALHGRVIPTATGVKLGNPNLKVIGFAGDGDTYSEGMSHFALAGRFNSNITLVVHDNQSFSLTKGQPTPTTQQGYKSEASPLGEYDKPINPIKLALGAGISFISRCNARDIEHTAEVLKKAIEHRGFSFVEVIQDCVVFNKEANNKDKLMYKIKDNKDKKVADKLADEYDYNSNTGKIPIGIIYQEKRLSLTDKWPLLKELEKKGIGWKGNKI